MNNRQYLLTVTALGILAYTLLLSPWQICYGKNTSLTAIDETYSPIFYPPRVSESGATRTAVLRTNVLLMEWAGIGIFYTALWFMFKREGGK